MDPKETGCEAADWIQLAQVRVKWRPVTNTKINFRARYKAEKFLTSCQFLKKLSGPWNARSRTRYFIFVIVLNID
jgi:hypothetical protein